MTEARSPLTTSDPATLAQLARQLRVDSIRASTSAGSGHPTSSMSAADLMAVLIARHLRYDWDQPGDDDNDHLIFSKGHASPLLYSMYKAVGVVSDEELMTGYRRHGSRLQGHPTPVLPWVDVATGSLGQGLPDGVGVALAGKYLDRLPFPRVGAVRRQRDGGRLDLGGAGQSRDYGLSNLSRSSTSTGSASAGRPNWAGISMPTPAALSVRRARAGSRRARFARYRRRPGGARPRGDQPTVVLARTIKGRGFSKSKITRAGTASRFPRTWPARAIAELGGDATCWFAGLCPPRPRTGAASTSEARPVPLPPTTRGARRSLPAKPTEKPSTALGAAVREVVALDGEVEQLHLCRPVRQGLSGPLLRDVHRRTATRRLGRRAERSPLRPVRLDLRARSSRRAYDFIRMAPISQANVRLVGSHAGVEIGADGPSQMALEDLA